MRDSAQQLYDDYDDVGVVENDGGVGRGEEMVVEVIEVTDE